MAIYQLIKWDKHINSSDCEIHVNFIVSLGRCPLHVSHLIVHLHSLRFGNFATKYMESCWASLLCSGLYGRYSIETFPLTNMRWTPSLISTRTSSCFAFRFDFFLGCSRSAGIDLEKNKQNHLIPIWSHISEYSDALHSPIVSLYCVERLNSGEYVFFDFLFAPFHCQIVLRCESYQTVDWPIYFLALSKERDKGAQPSSLFIVVYCLSIILSKNEHDSHRFHVFLLKINAT